MEKSDYSFIAIGLKPFSAPAKNKEKPAVADPLPFIEFIYKFASFGVYFDERISL